MNSRLKWISAALAALVFALAGVAAAQTLRRRAVGDGFYYSTIISQAQAATVSSHVMELFDHRALAIQTTFGDVTGTFAIMGSNDCANFYTIADVTLTNPAGTGGGQILEIGNMDARCYRVDYTHSSGTGAMTVIAHAKDGG